MALRWADELSESAPLPELEPFYTLAALQLGDPDGERWLERNSAEFHSLYRTYRKHSAAPADLPADLPADSAAVLIQYLVWYAREQHR